MRSAKYVFGAVAVAMAMSAQATPFHEGFDSFAALPAAGWLQTNTGASPTNPWFEGVGGSGGIFDAQSGGASSYAAADFLSSGSGAINNWLISPVLTLDAGSVLSFYARSAGTEGFGDYLEVLFSAGSGSDTSSFVSLGTIGSPGETGVFPTEWTQYTFALPSSGTGRFAFRQGGTTDTADYIGVDTVDVTSPVPEPSTYALMALGVSLLMLRRAKR